MNQFNELAVVMDALMSRYAERVPDVKKILNDLINEGVIRQASDISNDHIAFRTMGVPYLGIASLEKIFLHFGYTKRDHYVFESKKLDAYWYAPPDEKFPRIFISELRVDELSDRARAIIHSYTEEVMADPVDQLNLNDPVSVGHFLHQPLWRVPTKADYLALLEESEYAAWVIYNRYYLNHYTISVHYLKEGYHQLEQFNAFLERNGIKLNDAGGKIKTSPDGLLLQSSTVAQVLEASFANDEKLSIAGSYVEFAERRVLPAFTHIPKNQLRREHLREGFEANNADKIFESTFTSQINRN
ncbi:MAG: hypothetical protein RLZZ294_1787 [Bacteroidota bacterium]